MRVLADHGQLRSATILVATVGLILVELVWAVVVPMVVVIVSIVKVMTMHSTFVVVVISVSKASWLWPGLNEGAQSSPIARGTQSGRSEKTRRWAMTYIHADAGTDSRHRQGRAHARHPRRGAPARCRWRASTRSGSLERACSTLRRARTSHVTSSRAPCRTASQSHSRCQSRDHNARRSASQTRPTPLNRRSRACNGRQTARSR
mmetsp:Transcript_40324/g.94109  ORF Transcript_40324/g.94109 Transcript_40324/m.94109 type:complete len:205 (+) Transcript_40324:279-893(+)